MAVKKFDDTTAVSSQSMSVTNEQHGNGHIMES